MNPVSRPEVFPKDNTYYEIEKVRNELGNNCIIRYESRELAPIPPVRLVGALTSFQMSPRARHVRVTKDDSGRIWIITRLDDDCHTLSQSYEAGRWVLDGEWVNDD